MKLTPEQYAEMMQRPAISARNMVAANCCGGSPRLAKRIDGSWALICDECERGASGQTIKEAIDAWNTVPDKRPAMAKANALCHGSLITSKPATSATTCSTSSKSPSKRTDKSSVSLAPIAEFRFHPTRRWRFDYAWPEQKIALEIQGGIFTQGRHTRGPALLKEWEKLNMAAEMGWRIFYAQPKDEAETIRRIESLL